MRGKDRLIHFCNFTIKKFAASFHAIRSNLLFLILDWCSISVQLQLDQQTEKSHFTRIRYQNSSGANSTTMIGVKAELGKQNEVHLSWYVQLLGLV